MLTTAMTLALGLGLAPAAMAEEGKGCLSCHPGWGNQIRREG